MLWSAVALRCFEATYSAVVCGGGAVGQQSTVLLVKGKAWRQSVGAARAD